jgi:acyl transferase domain-containing protein
MALKANTGHLEVAAAGAGMIALFLSSLRNSTVAPSAQLRKLNPHLLETARHASFYILVQAIAFSGSAPGRLSSFGASGTIAHGKFLS